MGIEPTGLLHPLAFQASPANQYLATLYGAEDVGIEPTGLLHPLFSRQAQLTNIWLSSILTQTRVKETVATTFR